MENKKTLDKKATPASESKPRTMHVSGVDLFIPLPSEEQSHVLPMAPGEKQFLANLSFLGKESEESVSKAHLIEKKINKGDHSYWRGSFQKALKEYQDALLLVQDPNGKASIYNKLARTYSFFQRDKDAIDSMLEAFRALDEKIETHSWKLAFQTFVLSVQLGCKRVLQTFFPQFWMEWERKKSYGDRSRNLLRLFRELSSISQGEDEELRYFALLKQEEWAFRLQDPLEWVIVHGLRGEYFANGWSLFFSFSRWQKKMLALLSEQTSFVQMAGYFYLGRVFFLRNDLEKAEHYFEICKSKAEGENSNSLYEAALQHLVRIYRQEGKLEKAIEIANELLEMYHHLQNPTRLSLCCRHFALIYTSVGNFEKAERWAHKALEILSSEEVQTRALLLSQVRCFVLLANIEYKRGKKEKARRFLGGAISIQQEYSLPVLYIQDGMDLLREIRGEQKQMPWWKRMVQFLLPKPQRNLLFQPLDSGESVSSSFQKSLRISNFAMQFLSGDLPDISILQSSEQWDLVGLFPVGAVSSRWGKGDLSKDFSGTVTTDFSDPSKAPWGCFFADDIQ